MMTRHSALLLLLCLSVNVEAGFLSSKQRNLRTSTRVRTRDPITVDPPDVDDTDAPDQETPAEKAAGRKSSRSGRTYHTAAGGAPENAEQVESGLTNFLSDIGPAEIDVDEVDSSINDDDEVDDSIDDDDEVDASIDDDDEVDDSIDDDDDEVDAAANETPDLDEGNPGVEVPSFSSMEGNSFSGMFPPPGEELNGAPGGGNNVDTLDSPTKEESLEEEGEITDAQVKDAQIKDAGKVEALTQLLTNVGPEESGDGHSNNGDAVDLPNDLAAGNDGFDPMESEKPLILPFGNQAEGYVLGHTVSVCAVSLEAARENCGDKPICKFKKKGDIVTSEQKSEPSDCVRRCDVPLGLNHCQASEECFHFVFGCSCAPFEFDGGSCQPY